MRVRVFFHDRCFDGAASASLFARFYRERVREDVEFRFSGLVHRAGALFDESQFDGDENAIVDFKYSTSPKITWWFDHHQSAFLTPADAAHFEQNPSSRKFYDPDFQSCSKFLATIAEQRFGFDPRPVEELIEWADIVDGAQFPDAKTAVEMREPAMKLTMVIEANQDPNSTPRFIQAPSKPSWMAWASEVLPERGGPFSTTTFPTDAMAHVRTSVSAPNAKTVRCSST